MRGIRDGVEVRWDIQPCPPTAACRQAKRSSDREEHPDGPTIPIALDLLGFAVETTGDDGLDVRRLDAPSPEQEAHEIELHVMMWRIMRPRNRSSSRTQLVSSTDRGVWPLMPRRNLPGQAASVHCSRHTGRSSNRPSRTARFEASGDRRRRCTLRALAAFAPSTQKSLGVVRQTARRLGGPAWATAGAVVQSQPKEAGGPKEPAADQSTDGGRDWRAPSSLCPDYRQRSGPALPDEGRPECGSWKRGKDKMYLPVTGKGSQPTARQREIHLSYLDRLRAVFRDPPPLAPLAA